MARGSVTSGAAFKAAVRSTLVLVIVLALASAVAFYYMHREMMTAVENQIVEDQIVLTQIYADEGPSGLVNAIDLFRKPLPTRLRAVGLFDPSGQSIAGNFDSAPDFFGWKRETVFLRQPGATQHDDMAVDYYLNVSTLDGYILVVGRDLSLVDLQETRMLQALLLMGVVVGGTFLAFGYFASLKSLQKLERMAATLDLFSQGETAARLEVADNNDQIDRVSRAMNAHLDRLSMLMATTKASAAALAHDLRTPLARAFLSVDQALGQMDAQADPRAAVEEIEGELSRLRQIFDAILRISRLETADGDQGFQAVAIGPLMVEIAETFTPIAEDRGQTLSLGAIAPTLAVRGDEAMLAQLLANLVQNAITHCPAGTQISLAADQVDGKTRMTVLDTGPGIPADLRERVFDLFFRGDETRGGHGNGLGLALVKAIAYHMGATVQVSDASPGLRVDVVFVAETTV